MLMDVYKLVSTRRVALDLEPQWPGFLIEPIWV